MSSDHATLHIEKEVPIGTVPTLLCRGRSSWLARRTRMLWSVITNLGTFFNVLRLLKLPPFAKIAICNRHFALKFLSEHYLVLGLRVSERAQCFLHHYKRLYDTLPAGALNHILHSDVELHAICEGGSRFALTMGRSGHCYKEGEVSLSLKMDGEILFTLSFTIVPGWIVKSKANDVLLISRLQGTRGCDAEQIRLAVKAMRGVHPRPLLLAALQGIATSLDICEIASVSATNHIAYCEAFNTAFTNGYDKFFSQLGITETAARFFLAHVPIAEKPLSLIKQGHKLRTKRRRAFKQQVQLACAEAFLKMTDCTGGASATMSAISVGETSRQAESREVTRTILTL